MNFHSAQSGLFRADTKPRSSFQKRPVYASRGLRTANNNIPQTYNRNQVAFQLQLPNLSFRPAYTIGQAPQAKLNLPFSYSNAPVQTRQTRPQLPYAMTKPAYQYSPASQSKPVLKSQLAKIVNPEVLDNKETIKAPQTAPILSKKSSVEPPQFYTPQVQKQEFSMSQPNPVHQRPHIVYQTTGFEDDIPISRLEIQSSDIPTSREFDTFDKYQTPAVKVANPLKPSVQNRINQIKKIVSNDDLNEPKVIENQVKRSISTENQANTKTEIVDVPPEWWDACKLSVVDKLEQYCKIKQIAPPEYTHFTVKEGKKFKYQYRVTVEGVTYSTYPEDFDTLEEAKIVCVTKAINEIKSSAEIEMYPQFEGTDDEFAVQLYACICKHPSGVFLSEIPNLFK